MMLSEPWKKCYRRLIYERIFEIIYFLYFGQLLVTAVTTDSQYKVSPIKVNSSIMLWAHIYVKDSWTSIAHYSI